MESLSCTREREGWIERERERKRERERESHVHFSLRLGPGANDGDHSELQEGPEGLPKKPRANRARPRAGFFSPAAKCSVPLPEFLDMFSFLGGERGGERASGKERAWTCLGETHIRQSTLFLKSSLPCESGGLDEQQHERSGRARVFFSLQGLEKDTFGSDRRGKQLGLWMCSTGTRLFGTAGRWGRHYVARCRTPS